MGVDAWALTVAALSLVWSAFVWFDARKDAREARDDADRALAAAETSALEAARSSDAAERAALALEQQVVLARPPEIDFVIRQIAPHRFALTNRGTRPVTNVRPVNANADVHVRFHTEGVNLAKGEAHNFTMIAGAGSTTPSSLPIMCDELTEPQHVPVDRLS